MRLPRIALLLALATPALALADQAPAKVEASAPMTAPAPAPLKDTAASTDSLRAASAIEASAADLSRIVDTLQTASTVHDIVTAAQL